MEMDDKNKNPNQFSIDMPDEIVGGVYSNFTIVGHTPSEFLIDFVQIIPGLAQGKLRSRIIMTPQHAKRLLQTLEENIARYENSFGKIPGMENNPHGSSFPPGFPGGGPAGIA
jgi:hypothetical protein